MNKATQHAFLNDKTRVHVRKRTHGFGDMLSLLLGDKPATSWWGLVYLPEKQNQYGVGEWQWVPFPDHSSALRWAFTVADEARSRRDEYTTKALAQSAIDVSNRLNAGVA